MATPANTSVPSAVQDTRPSNPGPAAAGPSTSRTFIARPFPQRPPNPRRATVRPLARRYSTPGLAMPGPSNPEPFPATPFPRTSTATSVTPGTKPKHNEQQTTYHNAQNIQQKQKTDAKDDAPPRPKKRGYHQSGAPILARPPKQRGPRLLIAGDDVREKPRKISGKSSPSLTSSSSVAKTKRPAIDMEASAIGEHDIVDLVNDIKSQNTNNGGGRLAKGGPWTAKEDEALRLLVEEKGERKWSVKAKKLNAMMREEYDALEAKARALGETPEAFGRIASQCLHRWKTVLKPGLNKGHWTTSEDDLVRTMVQAAQAAGQPVKWRQVAELLSGRMGKQCRERWLNHLHPSVKKTPWVPSEDEILFHAQAYFGSRWCEICRFIPGRTENAAKNRFNSAAKNRWLDSTGTVLGGETSKLFIQELLRTVNAKDENESSLPPTSKSLQSQLKERGTSASSSTSTATSASAPPNDPPPDSSSQHVLVAKKVKQPRRKTPKKNKTDVAAASSSSIVYAGLVRGTSDGASGGGDLRAVRGWQSPAGTGKFSAGVRRTGDGTARVVDKRRVVQPERYTEGGWAKHSDARRVNFHHAKLVQRDHPLPRPVRGKRLGLLLQEFEASKKDVAGIDAAAGGGIKESLVESVSGRRGDVGKTGSVVVHRKSNSSDTPPPSVAHVTSGAQAIGGMTRPSPNGRSVKSIHNRSQGEGSASSSLPQQQQQEQQKRVKQLMTPSSSSYCAASSASATGPPLWPSFDNVYSYTPSASVITDRNVHGATAAIAPPPSQQGTDTAGCLKNINLVDIHNNISNNHSSNNSNNNGNDSSKIEVKVSLGDFLLDTYNRSSQFDVVMSSLEGWGNAGNRVLTSGLEIGNVNNNKEEGGAGGLEPLPFDPQPAFGAVDELENSQGELPAESVAELVKCFAMPIEQNDSRKVAASKLPPLFDLPPLPGLLPPLGSLQSPVNPPPSPSVQSAFGGSSQQVAPATDDSMPHQQAVAPVNAVFGTQGSENAARDSSIHGVPPSPGLWIDHDFEVEADNANGTGTGDDHGSSAGYNASNIAVDHGNAAVVGGRSCRDDGNGFVGMLVDESEGQPAVASCAAAVHDPVTGASPLINVGEMCGSADQQQECFVSDGPMSELLIQFQGDSPIGGGPAPTARFWN